MNHVRRLRMEHRWSDPEGRQPDRLLDPRSSIFDEIYGGAKSHIDWPYIFNLIASSYA